MNLENYLNDLVEKGLLKKEAIGIDQIKALVKSAKRNLSVADKIFEIDEEVCFSTAYNSMLKIARALVYLKGFRPDDGMQHKTTVDVAGKILGANFALLIDKFDRMRKKRNEFTYDPLIPLGVEETRNALKTAKEFYEKVKEFLMDKEPQLKLF